MSLQGKVITVHEASIKTPTVEIKTLAINGKQMTLAVFRQLMDEDLIDHETGELRGQPWGIVNYFWNDCHRHETCLEDDFGPYVDPDRGHLHVIWQKGADLRRSAVWSERYPHDQATERHTRKAIEDRMRRLGEVLLATVIVGRDWRPDRWPPTNARTFRLFVREAQLRIEVPLSRDGYVDSLTPLGEWFWYMGIHRDRATEEGMARRVESLKAYLPDLASDLGIESDSPDSMERSARGELLAIREQITDWFVRVNRLNNVWRSHWRDLQALDQLFIAV